MRSVSPASGELEMLREMIVNLPVQANYARASKTVATAFTLPG